MQWSCPHCGVHLTVSDSTLGTGWSFSRCYKCGGFALIRRAEINVIKVDKAPPGERIILPEASQPTTMGLMSENATKKISKHLTSKPDPLPVSTQNEVPLQIHSLPQPLPELPDRALRINKIPLGMSVAGVMATISGIYLYIQSQTLLNRTHEPVAHHFETSTEHFEPKSDLKTEIKPEAKADDPAPSLVSRSLPTPIVDQVHQSAMAPERSDLKVRIRARKANLHSGPGMEFPVVGTADQDTQYRVRDWNDRWFKLDLENGSPTRSTAWIRNDLVQWIATPNVNPLRE